MPNLQLKYFILSLLCLGAAHSSLAINIPALTAPVIDQTNSLGPATKAKLSRDIRALHNNGEGPQVQVLLVNSLDSESIERFSIKVVDEWKLGDKERDDGVLFLVALQDRKMRIEVGQGLEDTLTDLKSWKIIQGVRDYFRGGRFDEGTEYAISSIISLIKGENVPLYSPKKIGSSRNRLFARLTLIAILLLIVFFFNRFTRHYQNLYDNDPWYRSQYGGGGFGSGSGGSPGGSFGGGSFGGGSFGGGSWGGGGGGFSGGGSSGGW